MPTEASLSGCLPKIFTAWLDFRNTLVHQYQSMNLRIVIAVIEQHLADLITFTNAATNYQPETPDTKHVKYCKKYILLDINIDVTTTIHTEEITTVQL